MIRLIPLIALLVALTCSCASTGEVAFPELQAAADGPVRTSVTRDGAAARLDGAFVLRVVDAEGVVLAQVPGVVGGVVVVSFRTFDAQSWGLDEAPPPDLEPWALAALARLEGVAPPPAPPPNP